MPQLKLENKTARILHISTGGGKNVAIPPTEGGVTLTLSAAEKASFDKNVATPEVQGWIAAGDLVLLSDDSAEDAEVDEEEGDLEDEDEGDER
jgi:hypothetical protein